MKLRKFAVTSMLAIAALGVATGTAHANPAPAAQGDINWKSNVEGASVVTTIDAGAFKVSGDGKNIELQDNTGKPVVVLPLAFQINSLKFPMEQKVSEDGKTVTLTPIFDLGKAKPIAADATPQPINGVGLALKDIASPEENLLAQQTFGSQLAIATASGGLVGTAIGCIVTLPTCVAGATLGGVIGTIVVGGPTLIAAGIGLGQTLMAEPGTTVYAKK